MTTIQLHRGTTARYLANDPVLADGEPALEYQTDPSLPPRVKYGNGVSHWTELPYADDGSTGGLVTSVAGRIGDIILTTTDIGGLGSAATHPATDFDAAGAAAARVAKAGDTMTGALVLPGDPTTALQAAPKQYVDAHAAGFTVHSSCVAATTGALPACTYANGAGGVGATLTGNANGALPAQDGITLTGGQRLLVKDQAASLQDGAYTVTQVGDASHPFILTRATDADDTAELGGGSFFLVTSGSTIGGSSWVQTVTAPTIGTTALVFGQVAGPTTITAGTAITVAGSTISVATDGVTDVQVAAANKDGLAATPSLRTLGTGAQQAAAGTDPRLTDTRTPTAHHTTHEAGGSDQLAIDASQIVAGLLSDSIIPSAIARDSEVSSAVAAAVSALVNSAPGLLDTLGEIAAALGNDPNVITNLTTLVGTKVAKSLYDANTILVANSDDTPGPLTIAEQTILGRITGGNIAALTPAQVRTLAGLVIGTDVQAFNASLAAIAALTPANNDFLQRKAGAWTNRTIEQVQADLGLTAAFPPLALTKTFQKPWISGLSPGSGVEKMIFCLLQGTATGVTATTLTDLTAPQWALVVPVGMTITMGGSTAVVTSASQHVLTFSGGWTGGTPSLGAYTVTTGACPPGYPGSGVLSSLYFATSAGTLNQDLLVKIYTDGETDGNHDVSCDFGTLFCSMNDAQAVTGSRKRVAGSAVMSGTSTLVVNHGLEIIPQQVLLTPQTPSDATLSFWVTSITGSQFTINTLGNYTGTVSWEAIGPGVVVGATEHVGTVLSQTVAGLATPAATYTMRYPIPFSTAVMISTKNVNNSDGGAVTGRCSYELGVTAPYRLKSTGSTWKNGGTERQQITSTATGGTFALNYAGQTVSGIARNASTATIQAALASMGFTGTCTGGPLGTAVAIVGALQPVGLVDSTTGGTTVITTGPTPVLAMPGTSYTLANVSGLTLGGVIIYTALCARSVPPYQIASTATGGTFTLTWNGQTTGTIAWNASAATVLAALAALTGWVSGGTTTGGPLNTSPVFIQQKTNAPLPITINAGMLTGGTATCASAAGNSLAPYLFQERDVSITVDGESDPSVYSGGIDSYFFGNGYFQSAAGYSTPSLMVLGANNINGSVNAALDLLSQCGGIPVTSSFVWTLGTEAAVGAAHEMSYVALYYKAV